MTTIPSHLEPPPAADRQPTLVTAPNREAAPVVARSRSLFTAKRTLLACDALAIATAMVLTTLFEHGALGAVGGGGQTPRFLVVALVSLPGWLVVFTHQRLYNTRFIARRIDELRRIVNGTALGTLLVVLAGNLVGYLAPRSAVVVTFFSSVILVGLEREIARQVFASLRRHGRLLRHVVIAGTNPEARDLAAMLQAEPWQGYRVVGFVDDNDRDPEPVAGIPLLGPFVDAADIVRRMSGASVIVAASGVQSDITNRLARDLLDEGIHVELSSTLRDIASHRLTVRPLGHFPVVYVEPVLRGGWRAVAKRAFDLVLASVALLITCPVVVAAAVIVKLNSRGPAVFRQTRVGRDGRPFMVLKLRSMVADAEARLTLLQTQNEADGPLFKMAHDPRVTSVGRFLRKTSIDELPQLWNVIRGEMSLVGPRPALPHETEAWDPLLTQRLRVKPGITGMWQVNGRSESSFEDYTRLDLYYVDNWSLTTDVAILLKTIPVVVGRRGAA